MKLKILLLFIISIVITFSESLAQNVGIGDGAQFTPDASSLMELRSTTKGFLMPRMTREQRIAIVNPAHGLMVIQTDDFSGAEPAGIWYYCDAPPECDDEWRNIVNMSNNVTFANILTGTNTQATMEVGNNASLSTTGTGTIQANIFENANSVTTAVDLQTTEVAGILPVTGGGTGTDVVPPAGSVIYSNGTSYTYLSAGTNGQVLSLTGGNPVWTNPLLPSLPDGQIWVGNGTNQATAVTLNGDATISNTGEITITGLDSYPIIGNPTGDNQVLVYDNDLGQWIYTTLNNGTVSSVGLALPSEFTVTVSPITTSGDLTAIWASQLQNLVFASPDGVAGAPSFRSIVAGDISSVNASSLVGTVAVTNGGTGLNAAPPAGSILYSNGTSYVSTAGTSGQVLTVNGSGIPTWTAPTMPSLSTGTIWLGGPGNVATEVTIGGDATISNTGEITITGLDGFPIGTGPTADNQVLVYDVDTDTWIYTTFNNGSVSSVALSMPTDVFDITGSPITDAGTFNVTFDSQLQNLVFASPATGDGTPLFRKIVAGDITSIDASTITSGVLGVNYGGTGLNAAPPAGSILYSNGTSYVATAGTSGQVLTVNGSGVPTWTNPNSGGTVTSVGLALPAEFTVTNSPVVAAGTLTGSWASQNQNLVFASPNGASGVPSFRQIQSNDIANIDASKITTGILSTTVGGTGTSVAPTANGVIIGNAAGNGYTSTAAGTTGQVLIGNTGGAPTWSSLTSLAWGLTGNTGTNPTNNFVGTTDAQDLVLRTNNTEYLRIKGNGTNNGFVGIGTSTPSSKFDILNGSLSLTNNDNNARQAIFYERSGHGGSNFSSFRADTQTANINYILPPSQNVTDYTRQAGVGILANTPSGTTGQLGWIDAQSFGGSFVNVYVTPVNGDYTATVDDFLIVISTENKVVTLPPAASYPGKVYYIVLGTTVPSNKFASISVGNATDKISASSLVATQKLEWGNGQGQYSGVLLVSDGLGIWYVISTRRSD